MQFTNLTESVTFVKSLTEFTGTYYKRPASKFLGGIKVITVAPTGNAAYDLLDIRIFTSGTSVKWTAWLSVNGQVIYRQGSVHNDAWDVRSLVLSEVCRDMFGYNDSLIHSHDAYLTTVMIPVINEFIGHDRPVIHTECFA